MSQTIQISEKSAALLAEQAAAHGLSVEAWIEELAIEKANAEGAVKIADRDVHDQNQSAAEATALSLVERMRALRSRVKPDPEGWTVKDYINYGRR